MAATTWHADAAPPLAPAPGLVVGLLALVGIAAGGGSIVLAVSGGVIDTELGEPLVIALLHAWLTISYVLCGLIAWSHRPASRFGPLMVAAGFATSLTALTWASPPVLFTIGLSLDFLPPVLFLHVFLAFPSGRLRGRFERVLVVTAYVAAIGLQAARLTVGDFGPNNLLSSRSRPDAYESLTRLVLVVLALVSLLGLGVLVARRRRVGRPLRRSVSLLVHSFGVGLVMIAALFGSIVLGLSFPQIRWATFATLSLAPVVFLVGLLHDQLARSTAASPVLGLEPDPAPVDLRDALARALRDPSVRLAFWLPDYGRYADAEGLPIELPVEPTRGVARIDRDGAHVAVVLHDPALTEEPELLDAVTAAAGIALENGRLHAELRARLDELRASRTRIVEAAQQERKRLERDLHDGAQQRLIALSVELGLLEERLEGDPYARGRLDSARSEIATSLEELRAVARGIHPAVVSGHGLEIALEQLVARAAVPVRLRVVVRRRLPERVEVAAFYLVSEALANIGKHAGATWAQVAVTRRGDHAMIVVDDDGVGGVDTERGSGLRGLADRVEALEGRLQIWSPTGGGTRLEADIPCAS